MILYSRFFFTIRFEGQRECVITTAETRLFFIRLLIIQFDDLMINNTVLEQEIFTI